MCAGDFERVDIGGVPELEAAYRTSIPVVEIDGERAFTYFVAAGSAAAAAQGLPLTVPRAAGESRGHNVTRLSQTRRKGSSWRIG